MYSCSYIFAIINLYLYLYAAFKYAFNTLHMRIKCVHMHLIRCISKYACICYNICIFKYTTLNTLFEVVI